MMQMISLFGVGGFEILLILLVTLLLFGSKQLPEIARTLGKSWREIKKTTDELKKEFDTQVKSVEEEVKNIDTEVKEKLDT